MVGLVGVLLVTGCAVQVVDDASTPPAGAGADGPPVASPSGPDVASPSAAGSAPAPTAPAGDGAGDAPDGAPEGGRVPLLDRAVLLADVTRSGPCGGDVTVPQAGAVVELTGDCGTLAVTGAASRVVAGHVEHLVVRGGGAAVVVTSADRVTIDAAGVRVAWEDGEPQVASSGADVGYGPVGTVRLAADG